MYGSFASVVFEKADQSNWSGACGRIYCTPLSLPFPVHMAKGEVIWRWL